MNILCNIILFLLYYKVIKSSEKKYNNFLNVISKLKENSNSLELLNLEKNEIKNQRKKVKIYDELSKFQNVNNHPHFRSKFSFMEDNNHAKEVQYTDKQNNEKNNSNTNKTHNELSDAKSQLETQEIIKKGEHFYMNGGGSKYEYNDDEDFFSILRSNHEKHIEIHSPCFNVSDAKTCTDNSACFYDSIYQACFQKCMLLEEKECLKYTECKITNNGCENQGYINLQVFGNDLGSGIRGCELFETESSCYLMEKNYKKLGEHKTNFNCLWLSYKHEWKTHEKEEIHNNNVEENEHMKGNSEHVRRKNYPKEKNGDINYNILSNDKPNKIAKNEKFLSLLELQLKEKQKKEEEKNNKKKKKGEDEEEDFDDNNEEEEEQNMNEKDHDNSENEEEEYDEDSEEENGNKKKNEKKDNVESKNENASDTKSEEYKENNIKKENIFKKDEIKISQNNSENEKNEILMENINENNSSKNENSIFNIDVNRKKTKKHNDENNMFQNEKEVMKHDFHRKKKNLGNEESVKVETHICANLNERPNPSVLLEGALLAENEAELQKVKKKYNVTENEICTRPKSQNNVTLIPDKKFYVIGEKIEFKCHDGYKLISTTNVSVCTGRNKIMPNITCESLDNFDETEKENIQKINTVISSGVYYTFTKLIGFIILILNILCYL